MCYYFKIVGGFKCIQAGNKKLINSRFYIQIINYIVIKTSHIKFPLIL